MLRRQLRDGRVVAVEEDFGDRQAAELAGAGVVGIFQAAVGPERFVDRALRVAQHPGHQPHDGVDDDHRRDLAAREHVVSDRERLGLEHLEDAFVEPFVTAAEEDDSWFARPVRPPNPASNVRPRGLRAIVRPGGLDQGLDRLDGRDHGRGHQDHPGAAAERPVVDLGVLALGPVADVVAVDLDEPLGDRSLQDAFIEESVQQAGEQGQDVEPDRHRGLTPGRARGLPGRVRRGVGAASALGNAQGSPGRGFLTPRRFRIDATFSVGWRRRRASSGCDRPPAPHERRGP